MSDRHSMPVEVESLCCELIEGVIDEPKLRRLEQLVLQDPEAKRIYIEYINLHAALGHYAPDRPTPDGKPPHIGDEEPAAKDEELGVAPPLPLPEGTLPSWGVPDASAYWVPLTGVLVILGLAAVWFWGGRDNSDRVGTPQVAEVPVSEPVAPGNSGEKKLNSEYVAELTWLGTADAKSGKASSSKNSLLAKGGMLRVQNEDVHVRFACGAEVTLHGPAVFHIESEKLARLEYGSLEAKVPPQAIGFRIDTPASKVIDLGTEFTVTVSENGNTNINVINGEVEAEAWRPYLLGQGVRRKLFEGDSLRLSPPVTESFRVDFDTLDALEVFDIVRHDSETCLLDPAAGLLTLKTQRGTICADANDNNNILVVPIPDRDFDAVLRVKRFEPTQRANHVSLATLDDQDNVYRISYWFSCKCDDRGFASTKEENTQHEFVRNAEGLEDTQCDMENRPFRLRIARKGDVISTYWSKASGPWIPGGNMSCKFKPRFVGFFATNPTLGNEENCEFIDCVIDSFELKLVK